MPWIPAGGGRLLLLLMVILGLGHSLHLQVRKSDHKPGVKPEYTRLIRQKREWIIPPLSIPEEQDNSFRNPIAKIQSDYQGSKRIRYLITGAGVTEPPLGIFYINERTGEVNVTGIVDREENPMFYLKGYALDQSGKDVEPPIDLRVKVLDINDNFPMFTSEVFIGEIEELSEADTLVMKLSATDADDPQTLNAKLAYKIISQEPSSPPMFVIIKETGEVRTTSASIDREQQTSYSLVVEVKDLDGAPGALAGRSTLKVKVKDVNDNIPYLEYEEYEGSVEENTANVEIVRMKAIDLDEEFTDNWLANFTIISGNEGGHFEIIRDSKTNEGILMIVKEADYEEIQNVELKVVVSNQAEYHHSVYKSSGGGSGGGGGGGGAAGGGGGRVGKSIPIKVKVKNVPEGPVFRPRRKSLVIKEGKSVMINQVIGSYQATDGDSGKIASNVKYAKEYDPDNWFMIDPITAEIKLSKIPDRESIYVVNGTYMAKILAISEVLPGKTATGTIAIEVEDENDNCPTLVEPVQTVCDTSSFINVTAVDLDGYPNGAPFTFTVIDEPVGFAKLWTIGKKDNVSVQLKPTETWPGIHTIQLLVTDNQGLSCPTLQVLKLTVCTCGDGFACRDKMVDTSVKLGGGAIALMILACLILLLIPLLLLMCYCGSGGKGFMAIPDGTEATILSSNHELAEPLNMASLPIVSVMAGENGGEVGAGIKSNGYGFQSEGYGNNLKGMYSSTTNTRWEEHRGLMSGAGHAEGFGFGNQSIGVLASGSGSGVGAGGGFAAAGDGGAYAAGSAVALNEDFLKEYFNGKAISFADEEDAQPSKDCILTYSQETESLAGSVGCCSFIESEFDETCLDNLGLKFKVLADICQGIELSSAGHIEEYRSYDNLRQDTLQAQENLEFAAAQEQEEFDLRNASQFETAYTSSSMGHHITEPETAMIEEVVDQSYGSSMYIHEPVVRGNVLVTEKTYTTGPPMRFEPLHQQNVLVTERVIRPASSMHKIIDIADGQNVMVTERMIKSDKGRSGLDVGELSDSQYLLVTERVMAPSSGLKTSMSIPDISVGQNVLVTERHYAPISSVQGNVLIQAERSGGQSVVENRTVAESGLEGQINFNQGGYLMEELPPSSSNVGKSTSRVTKYSTVQYTRS
ncbi:desmoglein-2 isoform X2 [Pelobates fuscus]|uniref:desmoglein-2 isoform X2 n=1 Tax=Pelobates fuscus TaxID=191477 RepID=UPI002FE4EBDE